MTKLGIKTNILSVLMCIVALVSGYVGALLVAGYILLCESDKVLRKTAIKVMSVMCLVSLLVFIINMLPDTIGWFSDILALFSGGLYIGFLSSLCSVLTSTVHLFQTVLIILIAIFALKGKEFRFKPIDLLVDSVDKRVPKAATPVQNDAPVVEENGTFSTTAESNDSIDVFG